MSQIILKEGLKIDIGCGLPHAKKPGFIGIDKSEKVKPDVVCDIEKESLPFKNNSVSWVWMGDVVEHIENFFELFREIYRVCKNKARVDVISPYYTSIRAVMDPTHTRYISERTFEYLNRDFYKFTDYGIEFKFTIEKVRYQYSHRFFAIFNRITKIPQLFIPNSILSIHVVLKVHK